MRSNHLNCPLPLTLESYWTCEADCFHCVGRRLNKIWGEEQRITNPENVLMKLKNSQKNKDPKTPLAIALKKKKVIWIGRKSDPYQSIEIKYKVTRSNIESLVSQSWPFLVCSKYLSNAERDTDLFLKAKEFFTFLVEITPGAENDWELFERKRTTSIKDRLNIARRWQKLGIKIGIRGEPFIPGYHTFEQFRSILQRIRSYGFNSYNTYNLHMNDYTMKRFLDIGLDIERIWIYNQDNKWRVIQKKLCQIADEENIILGCPDFINTGKEWISKTNTCCGVDIQGAFTFNTHIWKILLQKGQNAEKILQDTWEEIGTEKDQKMAKIIMLGRDKDFYTMGDVR